MYKHIEKDEKKLTDEEVVKAWEYCLNKDTTCENCPYDKTNYCAISTEEIIDLIHRLQAKIEELRKVKVIHETVDYCYEDLKEAQAEIERLSKKAVALEVETNNQKAEIERLTEERDMYADDLYWKAEVRKREDFITELTVENAELQKQVDELKKELEIANGTKNRLTIFDRIEIHDKAVKETAREIADWLITTESNKEDLAKIIKEHYGVEVE